MVLLAYAFKATGQDMGLTKKQIEVSDTNSDGKIDAIDASLILSFYAYTATGGNNSFQIFLNQ
jgi:hypothetical protein